MYTLRVQCCLRRSRNIVSENCLEPFFRAEFGQFGELPRLAITDVIFLNCLKILKVNAYTRYCVNLLSMFDLISTIWSAPILTIANRWKCFNLDDRIVWLTSYVPRPWLSFTNKKNCPRFWIALLFQSACLMRWSMSSVHAQSNSRRYMLLFDWNHMFGHYWWNVRCKKLLLELEASVLGNGRVLRDTNLSNPTNPLNLLNLSNDQAYEIYLIQKFVGSIVFHSIFIYQSDQNQKIFRF